MSVNCPKCDSTNTIKKGISNGKQRNLCKDCGVNFSTTASVNEPSDVFTELDIKHNRWVITSAVSGLPVHDGFFKTLLSYCKYNHSRLLVIPLKYKINQDEDVEEYTWDPKLSPYLFDQKSTLTKGLRIHANFTTTVTAVNPLAGLEAFSRGNSVIIGHPSLNMKTIAANHVGPGVMLTTTGCVTVPCYTETKSGEKAMINHSFSALVVEEDKELNDFHLRVLNADEQGRFYDLDLYYDGVDVHFNSDIPGIVLGDEHISFLDEDVTKATFLNEDSIVNVLKPKVICRHDSYDAYAGSHHHKHNIFTLYSKYVNGTNKVEDELVDTVSYIHGTTPDWAKSVIISSNHNDHLSKWLNECNPKIELWNATFYHKMMMLVNQYIESNKESTNPFKLWHDHTYPDVNNVEFVSDRDSYKIKGIELAYHGHHGINGSRGSAAQFAKLDSKTISGHTHSPTITNGAYVVGHSCKSKLEYNMGPSSWNHAHCLIQPNGRRQLVFIKNGKWRV